MPIIVSRGGRDARRLDPLQPTQERDLQAYIIENPMTVPTKEITGEVKLVVVAPEFDTDSGPIDVLAIGDRGAVYVIETKLSANPDKRRVVAQVLDYGAAMWLKYSQDEDFVADVMDASRKRGTDLRDRLATAFGEANVEAVLDAACRNVAAGDLQFVVVMEQLHDRLRNLIRFLNAKSQFSLYAVEMEFYHHDGLEIVIPRLFGAEVVKDVKPSAPTDAKFVWDADRFITDLTENAVDAVGAVRQLMDVGPTTIKNADFKGHHAKLHVSVGPLAPRPLFTVWSEDGSLTLRIEDSADKTDAARTFRERVIGRLVAGGFCPSPTEAEVEAEVVELEPSQWVGQVDAMCAAVREAVGPTGSANGAGG